MKRDNRSKKVAQAGVEKDSPTILRLADYRPRPQFAEHVRGEKNAHRIRFLGDIS